MYYINFVCSNFEKLFYLILQPKTWISVSVPTTSVVWSSLISNQRRTRVKQKWPCGTFRNNSAQSSQWDERFVVFTFPPIILGCIGVYFVFQQTPIKYSFTILPQGDMYKSSGNLSTFSQCNECARSYTITTQHVVLVICSVCC